MQKRRGGTGRYRSPYPSNANRMLYHVSYSPIELSPLLLWSSKEEKVSIGETLKIKLYVLCKNRYFETLNSFQTIFLLSFSFEKEDKLRGLSILKKSLLCSHWQKKSKNKKKIRLSRASFFSPLLSN